MTDTKRDEKHARLMVIKEICSRVMNDIDCYREATTSESTPRSVTFTNHLRDLMEQDILDLTGNLNRYNATGMREIS